MEVSGQLHASVAGTYWVQSRSGRGGEEKNSLPLQGLEPLI